MNTVKIVIESNVNHVKSVYALVMSILLNRYEENCYQICICAQENELPELQSILELQDKYVGISIEAGKTKCIENSIYLKWNTIVIGDLSEGITEGMIREYDIVSSPEEYFDQPLSEVWMRYYKLSPMGKIPLRRKSYGETLGRIKITDHQNSIPISVHVADCDVPYAVAMIGSISHFLDTEQKLDIRITYRNLTERHKKELLSLETKTRSIVLFNIQELQGKTAHPVKWIPYIFDEYDRVICINPRVLLTKSVACLYQYRMEPFVGRSISGKISEDNIEDIMILNTEKWVDNRLTLQLEKSVSGKMRTVDTFQMICGALIGKIPADWCICENKELALEYLAESEEYETLRREMEENERVVELQELLKKIEEIEQEKMNLEEQVSILRTQNELLNKEKNQFLYELLETRKSITYKVGRFFTFIPRKIRGEK